MKGRYLGVLAGLVFMVAFGYALSLLVTPRDLRFAWVTPRVHNRFPANVQTQNWDLAPKKMQLERDFFRSFKISSTRRATLIELEQFATMDSDGQLNMSCLVYDQLHLTFTADGEAISGEKPTIEINTECLPKAALSTAVAPIELPIDEIQKSEAKDGVLRFETNPEAKRSVELKVSNVHRRWPKSWFLVKVQFEQSSTHKLKTFMVNEMLGDVAIGELKAPFMVW